MGNYVTADREMAGTTQAAKTWVTKGASDGVSNGVT